MKTRIGIFGVGHEHGAPAVQTLRKNPNVEIVGLCEQDPEMLRERIAGNPAAYDGIPVVSMEELFAMKPDAAMVETSVPELVPMATECARRGLHLHMDKPAGIDLPAYKALLDILEQKHLVFQTGFMYRYNAGIRYCLEKVRDGSLGRIYNISAQMCTKHPEWYKQLLFSYHVKAPDMFIFGGHLLDLCLQIKGIPQQMQAFHAKSMDEGTELTDTSVAVLQYLDGIATVKVSSVEVNGWGLRELIVYGEKGTVELRPMESPMELRETWLAEQMPWRAISKKVDIAETGRYDIMMDEFVKMVRGEIPYDVDFRHEYELQKYTLLACGYDC